jgi:uncharacterized alpha-E superfamily protein
MLSRVAEQMYWFGRYMERAENTARLVNVNANLLLDLPRMIKVIWGGLIDITGTNKEFYKKYEHANEQNVIRFMLAEEKNPGSICSAISMVRENARITREIMPSEAWEQINELNLYVKQNVNAALKRDGRHEFLDDVIHYCHQITGLLHGYMSHGDAYNFIRIGRNLERADMTTRIADIGCMFLINPHADIPDAYENILWMNVLRSLSAYQMYRQYVQDRVNGEDVLDFLMRDEEFPRAIAHCLGELKLCIKKLPNNDHALRIITRVQRVINKMDASTILESELHEFIDKLQINLASIHTQVSNSWFNYSELVHEQIQQRN